MAYTYSGITPTLLFSTTDLQNTESVERVGRKLVANRDGVCQALVMDWLYKCSQIPGGVTQKSQLKSGLALSLAFSSYMLGTHAAEDTDDSFIESSGLSTVSFTEKKAKFFSTKAGRCQSIAIKLIGITGLVYISLNGHALGFRQQNGVTQFFDPNAGVFQFASVKDFSKWFPSFIVANYSTLLKYIRLKKVAA